MPHATNFAQDKKDKGVQHPCFVQLGPLVPKQERGDTRTPNATLADRATALQAVWRGRRSRQRPNYRCADHREHEDEKGREDIYEKGRLAWSRWPNGRVDVFRGDAGQERRWKTEWPRGHSSFYKGAPGYEYRWKTVWPISPSEDAVSRRPNSVLHGPPFGDASCRILDYSTGDRDRWHGFSPEGEFRVCVEKATGERNLYVGSVATHDLATLARNPRQVARETQSHTIGYRGAPGKEAQCRIEMLDGIVHLFRGPRNRERRYRTERPSGNTEHYIPSETNRFEGKRVYAEWPDGRIDWFGGPEDNRACLYSVHADGSRDHFRGDAGNEVRTHRECPDGHVQIFAMDGDQQYTKEERWPSGMRRVYTGRRSTDYTEASFAKWERAWAPEARTKSIEATRLAMEKAWAPYEREGDSDSDPDFPVDERGRLRYGGAYERDARKRAAEVAARQAELDEEHAAKARASQARAEARQRAREQAATAKKAKKERRRARAAAEKAEADRGAEAMQAARAAVDVVRAAVRRRQAARAEREREEAAAAAAAVTQRAREAEGRARRAEVAEAQQRAWDLTKRQAAAAAASPPPQPPVPRQASAECVICLDAAATHATVPCGHICLCADCAENLKACPLCRTPLVQTMRIYLVDG